MRGSTWTVTILMCWYMCFAGYGVTTDAETSSTARIMVVSLIPFLILLVAKILNSTTGIRIVILVSLLVSFAFLVTYCVYQVAHMFKKSTHHFSKYFLRKKKNHLSYCYALLNKNAGLWAMDSEQKTWIFDESVCTKKLITKFSHCKRQS